MPREFEPFAFERTAAPQPGLPSQKIMIIRHGDGSLHIGLRVNGRTSTVMMDPDSAAAIRAWMTGLDGYDGPTHAERLTALRDLVEEFEREHGPMDRTLLDEVHRTWPDVAYGGDVCCARHEDHERARAPRSMGMGKDGPPDLSQREGFE